MKEKLQETGLWLSETIRLLGISQREVAHHANMSSRTLSQIFKGKTPVSVITSA